MKTTEQIRKELQSIPVGEPFAITRLIATDAKNRGAVDQAVYTLVKKGAIQRVAPGVFMVPKTSLLVGKVVPPDTKAVVRVIAEKNNSRVEIQGAEAAWRLGLTTQVPARPVFQTTGRTRAVKVGGKEVILKHVSPRKLTLAGRPAGLALSALYYLGKRGVSEKVIDTIRKRIAPEEFDVLKNAQLPVWMAEVINRYEHTK